VEEWRDLTSPKIRSAPPFFFLSLSWNLSSSHPCHHYVVLVVLVWYSWHLKNELVYISIKFVIIPELFTITEFP
jgi:hypothetical protein